MDQGCTLSIGRTIFHQMRLDDDLKYFEEPEFRKLLDMYESAKTEGLPIYMDAEELTDVAEYYSMVEHDENRANEVIDLALQLHPDAVDPQIFRARQEMLKGNANEARYMCDAIEDQEHREVIFLRAELMVREQKVSEAYELLSEHSEHIHEDKDFFLYDSAYIFIDYRQFGWAAKLSEALEAMAPYWYKTWELRSDVFLGLENFQDALPYIERMLDVDPFSTEAWNWKAEANCGLSDYEEAMESLEYSLAVDPDNERALQLKAWILLQQGNFKEAHKLYLHEIERSPGNEQNWLYDSYCLLDADELDDAKFCIERAESLADGMSAEQSAIYEQHAQILSRKGEVDEAIRYIDLSEEVNTADLSYVDFDLLRARIYAENARPEEVLTYIGKACREANDEQRAITYFRSGQMLVDTAFYEWAKKVFTDLLAEDYEQVSHGECHAYLAYCAMEQHDDQQALENLDKAIQLNAKERLKDLFAEEFPNVNPSDYYCYYYYRVHGHFPPY